MIFKMAKSKTMFLVIVLLLILLISNLLIIFSNGIRNQILYKQKYLDSGKSGIISYIGMVIKKSIKSGKIIFPYYSQGRTTTSYKEIINSMPSSDLPKEINIKNRPIAPVDLMRMGLIVYPIEISQKKYDYFISDSLHQKIMNYELYEETIDSINLKIFSDFENEGCDYYFFIKNANWYFIPIECL